MSTQNLVVRVLACLAKVGVRDIGARRLDARIRPPGQHTSSSLFTLPCINLGGSELIAIDPTILAGRPRAPIEPFPPAIDSLDVVYPMWLS